MSAAAGRRTPAFQSQTPGEVRATFEPRGAFWWRRRESNRKSLTTILSARVPPPPSPPPPGSHTSADHSDAPRCSARYRPPWRHQPRRRFATPNMSVLGRASSAFSERGRPARGAASAATSSSQRPGSNSPEVVSPNRRWGRSARVGPQQPRPVGATNCVVPGTGSTFWPDGWCWRGSVLISWSYRSANWRSSGPGQSALNLLAVPGVSEK